MPRRTGQHAAAFLENRHSDWSIIAVAVHLALPAVG
jgi:hypothetical protein